jgi:predicted ATP-binding protein involved in virulence
MSKWVQRIYGEIPHIKKNVDLSVRGKNLIITGVNGSGKTSFLQAIYNKAHMMIAEITKDIEKYKQGILLEISDAIELSRLYDERKSAVIFFEEKRLSEISRPAAANAVSVEEDMAAKLSPDSRYSNKLEQHLVNLKNRQSLAITIDKNEKLAQQIAQWFTDFEEKLKLLFEDDSVVLKFDPDTFSFTIHQDGKEPYGFQTLSAGYRAIFEIYGELLMRTEYFKISPNELTGIVCIDEIDSHLHVSLQRLILPFFANSFPKIQFIVTTHSPFVLMSSPDTAVFDLAKNDLIDEDLSRYTYSAIMKGLWGVKPISARVERMVKEISDILADGSKDMQRLQELISELDDYDDALDDESRAFYLLGKEAMERAADV